MFYFLLCQFWWFDLSRSLLYSRCLVSNRKFCILHQLLMDLSIRRRQCPESKPSSGLLEFYVVWALSKGDQQKLLQERVRVLSQERVCLHLTEISGWHSPRFASPPPLTGLQSSKDGGASQLSEPFQLVEKLSEPLLQPGTGRSGRSSRS